MGAWSPGNFGNDAALDFLAEVTGIGDLRSAIQKVSLKDERHDSDLASEVLAAADILAAMAGRPSADLPAPIKDQLPSFGQVDEQLTLAATVAVERIRANSELAFLWRESGDEDWLTVVDNLLFRLDPSRPEVLTPDDLMPDACETPGMGNCVCHLCSLSIPMDQEIELTVEDNSFGLWSSSTLYAHRECVESRYDPPLFNKDGSPSAGLFVQFKDSLDSAQPDLD